MAKTDWVGVDWGTTHLRAWLMGPEGARVLRSDDGMGGLTAQMFEPALLALIGDHLQGQTPIIACGMVGARQGWVEAPYTPTPCAPPGIAMGTQVPTLDARLDVHILPGVSQDQPADVMRGEETQIAGYLEQDKDFDGVLCLPGTHTKWVHISAGEIVSFQSVMTGELFSLLGKHSVLRHSIGEGWEDAGFAAAVDDTISRPQAFAGRLFNLRAESLLHEQSPDTARARLSGLLIGLELAATKPYWLGRQVALIGDSALNALYDTALSTQGLNATQHSGDDMTLLGLTSAYNSFMEKQK